MRNYFCIDVDWTWDIFLFFLELMWTDLISSKSICHPVVHALTLSMACCCFRVSVTVPSSCRMPYENRRYRTGFKILPCGAPDLMSFNSNNLSFWRTRNNISVIYEICILLYFLGTFFSNFLVSFLPYPIGNLRYGILSKAPSSFNAFSIVKYFMHLATLLAV